MDRHELAWAAGFFDGEGWAARSKTRGVQARINQSDDDRVPEVLLRFQRIVGLGRLHGPVREDGRKDLYHWDVSSRSDVAAVANATWPWLGSVKRIEFEAALGYAPMAMPDPLSPTELLAWAGGLYDGEGCASLSPHRTHEGHFSPEVAVTQSGANRPQVLERFRDVLGLGRIYGPYAQEGATMPVFRWKAAAHHDVEHSLYLLSPWIGRVKREQARRVARVLLEQGSLPRGNPAWGNRKTHCVKGHEYATARVRPYVSRGRGIPPRENHHCLACLRDYASERRPNTNRRPITTADMQTWPRTIC
jgi:hypothetical protein